MPSGTAACECLPLHHAVFVHDAVELVEELLVAEASRSLIRHGDDCLLVSRSPDPRLIRERNERKDRFLFSK